MTKISEQALDPNYIKISLTTYLTVHVNAFRNGPEDRETGCVETMARRVVGELAYAGLVIAATVETIFRLILSAFIFPFVGCLGACLDIDRETMGIMLAPCSLGCIVSLETTLKSASFLVKNFLEERIEYGDAECITCNNTIRC